MSSAPEIILHELVALDAGPVLLNEPLRNHGTWRIGGPADVLVEPQSLDQLARLRRFIHDRGLVSIVIGEGSNLLFDDAGLRGVCIKIGRALSARQISDCGIWAEAGVAIPKFARAVGLAGFTGLEHAVGIPGTLGGLVVMNGGSRRKSIGDTIARVDVMDKQGDVQSYDRAACGFVYRGSVFQDSDLIIVRVDFELRRGDPKVVRREMLEILRDRKGKFPRRDAPNCGSVFVSGGELYEKCGPPGKVIESLGFKGMRIGDALCSPRHANFIVNAGHASSNDMMRLIRRIRDAVHASTGIWMNCEVRHVSPEGKIRPVHETFQA